MPRKARIVIPGEPLHIVDRGVNRGACFVDDSDRAFYLDLLEEQLPKWQCELHAFVLMSNHVHLLLTPWSEKAAAALMRRVAQRHTQRFNKRWQRTGPMWEGRFKSFPIESHRETLICQRYIEENPLRAGMVQHPADYRWSSFQANALGARCSFLTEHPAVTALHDDPAERRLAYRAMFDSEQPAEEIQRFRAALRSGRPISEPIEPKPTGQSHKGLSRV